MKKKALLTAVICIVALSFVSCKTKVETPARYSDKEAIENILARKSVRSFEAGRVIEQEKIDLLMRAGMAAPSGMDRRPWEIVVVNDRAAMSAFAQALPYAKMLEEASIAIVVCGDRDKSHYWYIDCSAVGQNILLAAEALGLGAVWTGVYTSAEREKIVSDALGLPENIIPLTVIPVGYPKGEHKAKDKYDPKRVHYNKW